MDNQHHHVLFYNDLAFYDPSNKSTASQEFPIYQPMKSNFPDLILAIEQMNDRSSIIQMEEEINQIRRKLRKMEENIEVLYFFMIENLFCRRIESSSIKNATIIGFSS